MRIYEYAKKIGVTSKELLERLAKGGFDFASHMSVLSEDAEKFLKKPTKKIVASKKEVISEEKIKPLPAGKGNRALMPIEKRGVNHNGTGCSR